MKPRTAIVLGFAGGAFALALSRNRRNLSDLPLEGYAPFEPVTGCNFPHESVGARAFRAWVLARYGGADVGITRPCAKGAPSAHHEGRAWDWGPGAVANLPSWKKSVARLLERLHANGDELARRAGLRVIIYDRHMWLAGSGSRPYGGADPHTLHVHFTLSRAAAGGKTSFYTDPAVQERA